MPSFFFVPRFWVHSFEPQAASHELLVEWASILGLLLSLSTDRGRRVTPRLAVSREPLRSGVGQSSAVQGCVIKLCSGSIIVNQIIARVLFLSQ